MMDENIGANMHIQLFLFHEAFVEFLKLKPKIVTSITLESISSYAMN